MKFPLLPLAASLGLLVFGLPLSPSAQTILPDPTPPPNPPGTPTPDQLRVQGAITAHYRRLVRDVQQNTDNVKSSGNFGAQLWLVPNESFFQDWRKPEPPPFDPVQVAVRGQAIYTAIIFYGPSHDAGGLSNVSYDINVTRPDGTVYNRRDALVGYQSTAPDDRQLLLGRNYLAITITTDDPAGKYTVDVTVHDKVNKVDLPLKQSFVVQ